MHSTYSTSWPTRVTLCVQYRKSQGLEWVAYDMAYRRKAAYTKNLNCNVAEWLREASIVHALPKRGSLGSTLPTHWGQSALLTCSTVGNTLTSTHITVHGQCPRTDPGHNPQIHKDSPYSLLPMWQTHQVAQDLHTTNGSQLHVGCTMLRRDQGATTTLANLPTAAAHVGDLTLPPCAACLSIQRELNVPSGARVHPLQPKVEDTKLQLCQTIQAQDYAFSWSVTISKHLYT